MGDAPASTDEPANPSQLAQRLVASILFQSLVTAAVLGIAATSDATRRDLGIQSLPRQLARDIGVGLIACLAAVAPVYGIQGLLLYLLQRDDPSHHPLIEMVTNGQPNVGIMLLAAVAAVIVAPICEEITYRLVLQGWLEKWEDEKLGWRTEQANDEARMTNHDEPNSSFVIRAPSFPDPPRRGVGGLPYGWMPILVSSALFALAHYGYGPEPAPIFLLALVLGYVYQRTHRIIPCIVAHALFNLLTMLALWRMVFHATE
jgi:membrane protease YdiL (CAAX protease family)